MTRTRSYKRKGCMIKGGKPTASYLPSHTNPQLHKIKCQNPITDKLAYLFKLTAYKKMLSWKIFEEKKHLQYYKDQKQMFFYNEKNTKHKNMHKHEVQT